MHTDFVLIDSENVKPDNLDRLRREVHVFIFVGPNFRCPSTRAQNGMQLEGAEVSYIQMPGRGRNALDFHIAYYLGKLSANHPKASFHIVSKDKGFDPLIQHLDSRKVCCRRWTSVLETSLLKPEPVLKTPTLKLKPKQKSRQLAANFYQKRIAPTRTRPATLAALLRTIRSHHPTLDPKAIAAVQQSLIAKGKVVVNGNKVTYP